MKLLSSERGISLTEALVAGIVLVLALIALLTLLIGATKTTSVAKIQTTATELANERIEYIRTLNYDDIGTPGGDPEGILQAEQIARGNVTFNLSYAVSWIDDAADGTLGEGTDSDPHDYKRVEVRVTWTFPFPGSTVRVTTNIREEEPETSPPTIEFVSPTPAETTTAMISAGPVTVITPVEDDVTLAALAQDTDGVIDIVNFYVDNHSIASRSTINQSSVTKNCKWETEDFQDGTREIKAETFDNMGARDYRTRYLVVDNGAPSAITDLTATASRSPKKADLSWSPAMDGTDLVHFYDIYRSTSASGPFTKLARIYTADYAHTDSGHSLQHNRTYYYYVDALSPLQVVDTEDGFKTPSNTVAVTIPHGPIK